MDTSMTLYAIAEEYRDVMGAIIEAGGELTPEIYQRFNDLAGVPQEKLQRCGLVMIEAAATIDAIKAEEKRLADMRKSREAALRRFREYVKDQMIAMDIKKIEGDLVRLTVAQNPEALEITDPDQIPPQYYVERTICELDKAALKDALKADLLIPGATLTRGTSLRVK